MRFFIEINFTAIFSSVAAAVWVSARGSVVLAEPSARSAPERDAAVRRGTIATGWWSLCWWFRFRESWYSPFYLGEKGVRWGAAEA